MRKLTVTGAAILFTLMIIMCGRPIRADESGAENIFIGDSRTVMMYFATHPEDRDPRKEIDLIDDAGNYWKCKGATGYKYMKEEALPATKAHIKDGTNVIILFGVNDNNVLKRVDDYAEVIKAYAEEVVPLGADVYYATVGPMDYSKKGKVSGDYSEDRIKEWNDLVIEKFDWDLITMIDLHGQFGEFGYADPIHYDASCSKRIFSFLLEHANGGHRAVGDALKIANRLPEHDRIVTVQMLY